MRLPAETEMGAVSIEVLVVNESELPELRDAQRRQMRQAVFSVRGRMFGVDRE